MHDSLHFLVLPDRYKLVPYSPTKLSTSLTSWMFSLSLISLGFTGSSHLIIVPIDILHRLFFGLTKAYQLRLYKYYLLSVENSFPISIYSSP